MAEPDVDEDLFADLYDNDDADADTAPVQNIPEAQAAAASYDDFVQPEPEHPVVADSSAATMMEASGLNDESGNAQEDMDDVQYRGQMNEAHSDDRPIGIKEDGKMFIGGLNWETTDQSLKDYFSQFGEVIECTVMRDGATGRSRGFGFLTFKDPKNVNTVMVKEHSLDGKLIDPKRAIPREEQERTAKIFVGGVSQEATEADFKDFFMKFGRVLDATLMMDKDTGRPRGFGFVTFDNDAAVERTLEGPLAILGKPIEVKRAQPRGKMGEEEATGKFGRAAGKPGAQQFGGFGGNNNNNNSNNNMNNNNQMGPSGDGTNQAMTPAMMAQYWQRMQQYFSMMSAANGMGGNKNMMGGMQNPMMQQMMSRQGGMSPGMMQQMGAMQGYPGGMQNSNSPMNGPGGNGGGSAGGGNGNNGNNNNGGNGNGGNSNNNGGNSGGQRPGFSAQEQLMFEQQKYERQQMARMQQQNFGNQNTWEGMYDDVPAPTGMQSGHGGGNMRGNFGGRGGRGGGGGGGGGASRPQSGTPSQAPANAPTGPKNAGKPGANYRGGGRGGHRGFHPYARGGG